jgi:hypothetical protein
MLRVAAAAVLRVVAAAKRLCEERYPDGPIVTEESASNPYVVEVIDWGRLTARVDPFWRAQARRRTPPPARIIRRAVRPREYRPRTRRSTRAGPAQPRPRRRELAGAA